MGQRGSDRYDEIAYPQASQRRSGAKLPAADVALAGRGSVTGGIAGERHASISPRRTISHIPNNSVFRARRAGRQELSTDPTEAIDVIPGGIIGLIIIIVLLIWLL